MPVAAAATANGVGALYGYKDLVAGRVPDAAAFACLVAGSMAWLRIEPSE
jgi:hypothetical protein